MSIASLRIKQRNGIGNNLMDATVKNRRQVSLLSLDIELYRI
ncbi:hypothetical protein [Lactobacillus sp. ESL0261]|nr:hypothetical protein [Lactobacillus sp. ESL0261]